MLQAMKRPPNFPAKLPALILQAALAADPDEPDPDTFEEVGFEMPWVLTSYTTSSPVQETFTISKFPIRFDNLRLASSSS